MQTSLSYFDTHAHLNFSRFKKNLDEVIEESKNAGVAYMVVPGTDRASSKRAVEIAEKHEGLYAAVGIHPHHVFEFLNKENYREMYQEIQADIEGLVSEKVVAIGEIGLDRHVYEQTKYENYHSDDNFLDVQKELFILQMGLAKKHQKALIIHNREASGDLLELLTEHWDSYFEFRMVFHCCEPNKDLLDFALKKHIFIGVDGDVTYFKEKQEFITNVPLSSLVLETDAPFLLPEPLRSEKKYPNTPINLPLIAQYVARLRNESVGDLARQTTENGLRLFNLTPQS